jgi:glycosyltransferase involved in cell wall biosynthesis
MRVAFVNQTGAQPGGAEESLTLFLQNLPADIDPSIVTFEDGAFAQRLRDLGFRVDVISVPQKLRSATRERPSSFGALALPGVISEVARFFRGRTIDLVHTNTMKAHIIAAPAARLAGVPSVMHLRDMVPGTGRAAVRFIARTCSRQQIAISNALSRWYGVPRTTVVSNPVDLSRYTHVPARMEARKQLGIPLDGMPLVGIVGRINRWKGHDTFLRAVAAVNERLPVRCAIIGEARFRDADFVPELHRLAADVGLGDRVTFVPWLDDPRVGYAALDVHCNCSEREPFGRSIIEAAAAGVPTIAFDDGGAVDIIEDGEDGRLIAAGDVEAFSQALFTLLHDADVREQTGRRARERSARFDAPHHARIVADILRGSLA